MVKSGKQAAWVKGLLSVSLTRARIWITRLLPQSALTLDDDGRLGVRTVSDGRAAFVPVSVVRDTTDGVWVSGLDATAEIIVVGQEYVTDGVPVAPTLRENAG